MLLYDTVKSDRPVSLIPCRRQSGPAHGRELGVEMLTNDRLHSAQKSSRAKPDESCADQVTTAHVECRTESGGVPLKSRVIKRSIVIGGHRTSVSLEDAFWDGLKQIAHGRDIHLSDIVRNIDVERQHCNLSSAIRLFVFAHFRK